MNRVMTGRGMCGIKNHAPASKLANPNGSLWLTHWGLRVASHDKMAIDPICGMTVDEANARSAERDGLFFSEYCRHELLSS